MQPTQINRVIARDHINHNRKKRIMKNTCIAWLLAGILSIAAGCHTTRQGQVSGRSQEQQTDSIHRIMKRVADWQIDSIRHKGWRHPERDWTNGALYAGMLAFASTDADCARYYDWMRQIGDKFDWKLTEGRARYFADNYCVGQMYCRMSEIYHDPSMVSDLKLLADTLIARPHTESLAWKNNIGLREWAWCDALFMGPPSLAMLYTATGERKYFDLVDSLWWNTTDYLYDPSERLYFRDGSFLNKTEANGQKMFWSRGNGWVMGGMVRVIENMPDHYPDRERWVKLYRDMATRIASLQQPDGTWHSSLLDPAAYPIKETSGTTFFCYALAWGINHGLLDRKEFTPVVRKAWAGLVSCVHPDGMLGYVQRIGGAPGKVSAEDTEVYAVGAFLLAGREMLKLARSH